MVFGLWATTTALQGAFGRHRRSQVRALARARVSGEGVEHDHLKNLSIGEDIVEL